MFENFEKDRNLNKLYTILANSYINEITVKTAFLDFWEDRKNIIKNSSKFVLENFEEY